MSGFPCLTAARSAETTTSEAPPNPLAPFDRLVGGKWHLEGTYQEFEWGVGRRSVKSRSYFLAGGEPKLVSEGVWFWHPGEEAIKGYATAVNMPVVFFDYTTRFEGDTVVSDLHSYMAKGKEETYVETWEMTGEFEYVWKLLKEGPEGLKEVMGGTFTRRQD